MWNKKAKQNVNNIERRFDNWRDYKERGKYRRTARIFFVTLTRKIHEMVTTKTRRHKIC